MSFFAIPCYLIGISANCFEHDSLLLARTYLIGRLVINSTHLHGRNNKYPYYRRTIAHFDLIDKYEQPTELD